MRKATPWSRISPETAGQITPSIPAGGGIRASSPAKASKARRGSSSGAGAGSLVLRGRLRFSPLLCQQTTGPRIDHRDLLALPMHTDTDLALAVVDPVGETMSTREPVLRRPGRGSPGATLGSHVQARTETARKTLCKRSPLPPRNHTSTALCTSNSTDGRAPFLRRSSPAFRRSACRNRLQTQSPDEGAPGADGLATSSRSERVVRRRQTLRRGR